jgi:hypothetical protein
VTLAEFLLARIAEDEERVARWDSDGRARVATMWTGGEPGYTTVASDHADEHWVADGREVTDARHVRVLFDPARVLAECEAKRRIVARQPGLRARDDVRDVWWDVLALLALPYADHPDYRPEWKP